MTGKMVSQASTGASGPGLVPSLAEVQRDPTILEVLSVTTIVALRRQVSHLAADLDAAFCQAMMQASRQERHPEVPSDRLLTP